MHVRNAAAARLSRRGALCDNSAPVPPDNAETEYVPHLIVEYSANLEHEIALDELLDKLRASALDTGIFPLGGLRVRAVGVDRYRIADCDPANGYVHVTALIGHGRPLDVRKRAGERLFATLTEHLEETFERSPLAISFNIQEFHPELNFKRNNLHAHVRRRTGRGQPRAGEAAGLPSAGEA